MAWLFGQVWLLCLVAFVLGSAATWVAFVVPARRTPTVDHGWHPAATPPAGAPLVATGAPPRAPEPQRPIQDLDSALAAIDSWKGPPVRGTAVGDAATGALDDLGVGRPEPERPAPADTEEETTATVPDQAGPVDEPPRS